MNYSICLKSSGSAGNSFPNSLIFKYKTKNLLSSFVNVLLESRRGSSFFSYLVRILLNFSLASVVLLKSLLKAVADFPFSMSLNLSSLLHFSNVAFEKMVINARAMMTRRTATTEPAICLLSNIPNSTFWQCQNQGGII